MSIEPIYARQAAEICGFETVAMLDYLQRCGVFVPSDRKGKRRGRRRRYDFRELLVLKAISALLRNGASVLALKNALQELQGRKWKADEASLEGEDGEVIRYFVASGKSILFAKSANTLFDLTNDGQMVFSFVLDLDKLHSELCFQLRQKNLPLSGAIR